jgi:hypothetical protein
VVNSSVVWLLEFATDTHQLSTWVYIHFLRGCERKLKNLVWYITVLFNSFEIIKISAFKTTVLS